MIDLDEQEPYRVALLESRYHVVDWENAVVLVCEDPSSAEQYAGLMNAAFRRGFKAGLREGRRR